MLAAVRFAREQMAQSARDGYAQRPRAVYGREGEACPRCGDADPRRRAGRAESHDLLVPRLSALIRVGHKGADAIAPGNTLASFDAALAAGVDMIEFDVLALDRDPAGELYIAHDHGALDRARPLTLARALEHLSSPPFDGVRLQLDLKRRGCERARARRARAVRDAPAGVHQHRAVGRARSACARWRRIWRSAGPCRRSPGSSARRC